MKERWNERAARDPFFFVETTFSTGDVQDFFQLGEDRTQLLVDPVLTTLGIEPGGLDALELGCGLGRFSRALARRFRTVLALDVSEGMVRKARELNPEAEYPGLTFAASDGLTLPAANASADFVFSYEVFQHMPTEDVIAANLKEVARVLRQTGTALIHFPQSERLVLRFRAGRAIYASVRNMRNRIRPGDDALIVEPTFSGAPSAGLATIIRRLRDASLDVIETSEDPTNVSHVFAVVQPAGTSSR